MHLLYPTEQTAAKDFRRYFDVRAAKPELVVVPRAMGRPRLRKRRRQCRLGEAIDVSTASRATFGCMIANNSSGGRSLRYGTTRDNVISVEAMLADRRTARFGEVRADLSDLSMDHPVRALLSDRSA